MRARSRMAPLALVGATSIALAFGVAAQTSKTKQDKEHASEIRQPDPPATDASPKSTADLIPLARLDLRIAGLGREGCEVEIKPGNPSCKFRVINSDGVEGTQHVPASGAASVELRQIELRGADRLCTVAVAVHEPGLATKTVYRGFRLPARAAGKGSSAAAPVPIFTCFLSSPSKLAGADSSRNHK
jgi:hypothetical protein